LALVVLVINLLSGRRTVVWTRRNLRPRAVIFRHAGPQKSGPHSAGPGASRRHGVQPQRAAAWAEVSPVLIQAVADSTANY